MTFKNVSIKWVLEIDRDYNCIYSVYPPATFTKDNYYINYYYY